jgi:hypothetical protein
MNNQPNQPDTAIDKTLAALNAATPPEGLEARVAAHLAAQPAVLPRHDFSAAWWRGAATGAAFALLAVTAVLLFLHKAPPPNPIAAATPAPHPTITPVNAPASTTLCAHPATLRAIRPVSAPSPAILLAEAGTESAAPSHPAPVLPLTAQERALARLARTADPQQLIALSSEPKIKPEVDNPAASTKPLTPPPAPAPGDQPASNPPANPEAAPAATSEPSPASTPGPAPEAAPEPTPAGAPQATPPPAP